MFSPKNRMPDQVTSALGLSVDDFMSDGFDLLEHLSTFLNINVDELSRRLPNSGADLATLHPGAFDPLISEKFYEETVGDGHLLELAAWHLGSAAYIADTLRLQGQFARGQVLDFGGGIGGDGHALLNWYFFRGFADEYPFNLDNPAQVERFFCTLQSRFLEVFHPWLITTRA